MRTKFYNSKIGWWAYVLALFFIILLWQMSIDPKGRPGIIILITFYIVMYSLIITTKYAIRGNELGVKYFYRWKWFPIDKIESITQITNVLASPTALSTRRIAIKFSDRKILKSVAPLEISPKNRNGFIAELLKINPNIKVSL